MKRVTCGLVWQVEFLIPFALRSGLFFRLFGLRFCTSNSSSLLRFVAFVIFVEFLGAFARCGRPLFELKKRPVFQLRGSTFARRIPHPFCARQPFVEFLVAFALVLGPCIKTSPKST